MAPSRTSPRLVAPIAAGLALLALILLAAPRAAEARATLGHVGGSPRPSCPKAPCEAVGRVTGLQLKANGQVGPFKARETGKVVAWAIDLSHPNKEQRDFFGNFYESNQFGVSPTARISVLKRQEGRTYKLRSQSPVVDLTSSMGIYQVFTLGNPMGIRKGEFLALTIPTWAPSFAVDLSGQANVWRASRAGGGCTSEEAIRTGKPQQKVGSEREYGCDYRTARLLYWGFYAPKRGGDN